jgi:hypothetical protein
MSDDLIQQARDHAEVVGPKAAALLVSLADEVVRLRKMLIELQPMLEKLHRNNKIISEIDRALAGEQGDG